MGAAFDANYTDGIVVLHRGRIVYERYAGALAAERPHIAFSVTKSFVATLAGILIAEGRLNENATVGSLVPELQRSGFGDATVRQLLDMTTASTTPRTTPTRIRRCGTWAGPSASCRSPPATASRANNELSASLSKARPHGERFIYKTANTDALGWVLRRVSGQAAQRAAARSHLLEARRRTGRLLPRGRDRRRVCRRRAAHGAPGSARFGETMRLDGRFNGQQIVPRASWTTSAAAATASLRRRRLQDAAGRQLPQHVVGAAQPARRLLGARHSRPGHLRRSHGRDGDRPLRLAPPGANANLDPTSLPAYQAVAELLLTTPR